MGQVEIPNDEFRDLLGQISSGSQEAVDLFVQRYGTVVRAAVRRQLSRPMRRDFDSDDFLQTVWASFFIGGREWSQFTTSDELAAYLARMASNKVIDHYRRRGLGKRHRIVNEQTTSDLDSEVVQQWQGDSATPSQYAVANEAAKTLLDNQPSHVKHVLRLRVTGEKIEDIAQRVGLNERSVRRIIRRAEKRFE